MEFAIGALTSIAGGIGTAASAVGGAASTIGSVGSVLGGILGGGASLVSAMAAHRAGEARAGALMSQAADAQADAAQTSIVGEQRQTSLKRDLLMSLGKRDVAYAASGVDLSFGTPVIARQEAVADAGRAIAQDQAGTEQTRLRLLGRAGQLRIQAGQSADAGDINAIGDLLTGGYRLLRRG
jgi:hypothetical protein